MARFATAFLLGLILIAPGCDSSNEAVTDPSKIKPLSPEETAALRKEDDAVAQEENANPTQPTKGAAKK
jgi:hypothetical protein